MEIVQKSNRVGFYFKISIGSIWDPAKVRGAPFSFYISKKSSRRAIFFRKRGGPKANALMQRTRLGMSRRFMDVFAVFRKETSARHAFPPTIIIVVVIIGSS
jgi:hypothetical protein